VRQDLPAAELALARGARLDEARHDGRPLLNELVRWGQVTPALWLLEKGASPNVPDRRGWTAVHQAASRGNRRLLAAVLEHGGDPRRVDGGGETPRDVAERMGRAKLVALLPSPPARERPAKRGPSER
jgi:ankyrin repeat protein